MEAMALAEALEGKKEGNDYRCRCPVHGGRSLLVRDANRLNPLVVCMGGCEFREVVRALESQGLWEQSDSDRQRSQDRKTARSIAWAKRIHWWWRELNKVRWTPAGQDWKDWRKAQSILRKYDEKPPNDQPLFDNKECWH